MRCPHCGSSDVQKSSAVHEQDVRVTEGRATGIGMGSRGGFGIGIGRYASRSSTRAGDINAPPGHMPPRVLLASVVGVPVALGIGVLADSLALTLVLVVIALGIMIYLSAPNDEELRNESRWRSQWYCKRCGGLFFDDPSTAKAPSGSTHEAFVSPVLRRHAKNSRQAYIDRVRTPVQRAAKMTPRDAAGLDAIRERALPDGRFDPEYMGCDLGVISRLASLGLITYDERSGRFLLRETGEARPRGWWQRTFGA